MMSNSACLNGGATLFLTTFTRTRLPKASTPSLSVSIRLMSDRKSTRLNSSHVSISYAVFGLKKKNATIHVHPFARGMELRDLTTGTTIFRLNSQDWPDRVGVAYVEAFKSIEGIPIQRDHRYV